MAALQYIVSVAGIIGFAALTYVCYGAGSAGIVMLTCAFAYIFGILDGRIGKEN